MRELAPVTQSFIVAICCLSSAVSAQAPPQAPLAQLTPITPTPEEAAAQVEKALSLDKQAAAVREQSSEIDELKARIAALEADAQKDKKTEAAVEELKKRLEAKEVAERQSIEQLRSTTLPEWAGTVSGLDTGISAASSLGELGEAGLIFHPERSPSWTKWVDYFGRCVAGVGTALTLGTKSDADRVDGLQVAASGLALYLVADFARERLTKRDDIKTFVERVSIHKALALDVVGLNRSVSAVQDTLTPLGQVANVLLESNDPHRYKKFEVSRELVKQYQTALTGYDGLISELIDANRTATQLLDEEWVVQIRDDLTRIREKTDTAISKWRAQVLISQKLLNNMQTLADIDNR